MNLVTGVLEIDRDELKEGVMQHANLIRPWGWVLQLYAPMSILEVLGDIIPSLGSVSNLRVHPYNLDHHPFQSSRRI